MPTPCHYTVLIVRPGGFWAVERLFYTEDISHVLTAVTALSTLAPDLHLVVYMTDFAIQPADSRTILRVQDGVWRVGYDVPWKRTEDLDAQRAAALEAA